MRDITRAEVLIVFCRHARKLARRGAQDRQVGATQPLNPAIKAAGASFGGDANRLTGVSQVFHVEDYGSTVKNLKRESRIDRNTPQHGAMIRSLVADPQWPRTGTHPPRQGSMRDGGTDIENR